MKVSEIYNMKVLEQYLYFLIDKDSRVTRMVTKLQLTQASVMFMLDREKLQKIWNTLAKIDAERELENIESMYEDLERIHCIHDNRSHTTSGIVNKVGESLIK